MGLFDELKKLTRPYADDEEDFDEELDEEEEDYEEEPAPRMDRPERRSPAPAPAFTTSVDSPRSGTKVVSMKTTPQLQVFIVNSVSFENASEVADHLLDKQAVLLNLESTDKSTARRLVDFLAGCAYALDGKLKKVAASTYLITPVNVEIVGDLVEELESGGMYL